MPSNDGASAALSRTSRPASGIRGSVSAVAGSGGGAGDQYSHAIGARCAGSCASSSCMIDVPARGLPDTTIGASIGRASIDGSVARQRAARARLSR